MTDVIPLVDRPRFDDMTPEQQLSHTRALLVHEEDTGLRRVVWADDVERIDAWRRRGYGVVTYEYDEEIEKARRRVQVTRARRASAESGEAVVRVPIATVRFRDRPIGTSEE